MRIAPGRMAARPPGSQSVTCPPLAVAEAQDRFARQLVNNPSRPHSGNPDSISGQSRHRSVSWLNCHWQKQHQAHLRHQQQLLHRLDYPHHRRQHTLRTLCPCLQVSAHLRHQQQLLHWLDYPHHRQQHTLRTLCPCLQVSARERQILLNGSEVSSMLSRGGEARSL